MIWYEHKQFCTRLSSEHLSNTSLGTPLESLVWKTCSKILEDSLAIPIPQISETFVKFLPSLSFFRRAESAGLACLELCGTASRQSASCITHRIQRNTSLLPLPLSLFYFFPLQSPPSPFYFSLLIRVGESEKPAHPHPVHSCQILEQHSQFLLGVRNRLWKQKLIEAAYCV